jgi:hypothetical protein
MGLIMYAALTTESGQRCNSRRLSYTGSLNPMQQLAPCALMLFLALLSLILTGCGSKPETVPLSGTVKFPDGSPAAGAYIVFEGVDQPISATGVIEGDGTFRVRTFGKDDGIAKGRYRVVVTPPARDDLNGKLPVMKLDPKYKSFDTSGLQFEINDSPEPIDLVVTKK